MKIKMNLIRAFVISISAALMLGGCNASDSGAAASTKLAQSIKANKSVWKGQFNGAEYEIYDVGGGKYLISYGRNSVTSGFIISDPLNGNNSLDYSPGRSDPQKISVDIQITSQGQIGLTIYSNETSTSLVADPLNTQSMPLSSTGSSVWSSSTASDKLSVTRSSDGGAFSAQLGNCTVLGDLQKNSENNKISGVVSSVSGTCSDVAEIGTDVELISYSDRVIFYSVSTKHPAIFLSASPSDSGQLAKKFAYGNSACYQWVAQCREKCSGTALPTKDHGFSFWNCVSACAAIAGC